MRAFKAANPFDPCLVDFVRWYSPKDFNPNALAQYDQEHPPSTPPGPDPSREAACLSARMQEPGNVWQSVWDEADAAPVSRQQHVFDAVREANLALHYIEQLSPMEVWKQGVGGEVGGVW